MDYTALIRSVSKDEVRAFRRTSSSDGFWWARLASGTVVTVLVVGVIALFMLFFALGPVIEFFLTGDSSGVFASLVPLAFIGVIAAIAIYALVSSTRGTWERRFRLTMFATANNLHYAPGAGAPSYPGAIFGIGSARAVTDHLESSSGRYLDIGNYSYVTGSGKSQQTHRWGFLALNLDRALPNMMLDSKSNNGLFGTNLPAVFARDQVLSLEGDFDRYFTLYCPREYERDALYVFTPDLMALLIDEAAPFDVEIVDDWMFVYSSKHFVMTDPAVIQRLFRIVETVGAKTLSQTDRYADERIGDAAVNLVAPQGRRLRRGVSVIGVVFVVGFTLVWLLPQVLDLVN